MLRRLLLTAFVFAGFGMALPAAAIAPIVSQAQGAEADQIVVTIQHNGGNAVALGCSKCPIHADIDANTMFYLRGKPVSRKQAAKLSGEAGTLVYKDGRVIKIRWDTGHL